MADERDIRLESRFGDMDYVDNEVGRIISDLSDCLEGKCQKPEVLYLVSKKHCAAYGQTRLLYQLNGTGIKVETSSNRDMSLGDRVWAYDLDERKWISYQEVS